MKIRVADLTAIAAAVMFCVAMPACGQEDVTIDFTGVANTSVQALGAYAGYYTGTVDGIASNPGFICDDFNNDIFLPNESWQATAMSFASLATNPGAVADTLFGNTLNLDGYAAIAWLANLMASTPASGQADISAAIWYIGALGSGSYNNGPLGNDSISWTSLDTTAQNYVTNLLGSSGTFGAVGSATTAATAELQSSNLWLYTPTGKDIVPTGDPFPQEFIGSVAVAEGGTTLLYLLEGLACFGAMMYFRSRRQNPTRAVSVGIASES